jgi:hypothetical protein
MTENPTLTQSPPGPPRKLTARVWRRAWLEPHVRFWWLAAVVFLAAAVYLLVSRYLVWRESSRLISSGVPVPATVLQADESVARGKTESGDKSVRLEYQYGGKTYEVSAAYLEGRRASSFLSSGNRSRSASIRTIRFAGRRVRSPRRWARKWSAERLHCRSVF